MEGKLGKLLKKIQGKKWLFWGGIGLGLVTLSALALFLIFRPVPIETLRINRESITLKVGESCRINYAFTPTDATQTELLWKSSNREVATVQDGELTAVGEGSCYISAKAQSGVMATVEIIVEAPLAEEESLLEGQWTLLAVWDGERLQYVYRDDAALTLHGNRTGTLLYGRRSIGISDWRGIESIAGYDCYSVQTEDGEELAMYYCTDTVSSYAGCIFVEWEDGSTLVFCEN
ncbi:MAG: Ig-like domain-containing protein [Oscillospiraceae bacterium]|nr:Ig-like domain-containing protein [Oscillospiraceae bacterium]